MLIHKKKQNRDQIVGLKERKILFYAPNIWTKWIHDITSEAKMVCISVEDSIILIKKSIPCNSIYFLPVYRELTKNLISVYKNQGLIAALFLT